MSHEHAQASGVVLHRARLYDLVFGAIITRSDGEILARAGVGPGDRVLDVGTGPGYLALAAARLVAPGGAAAGIDASPEMIARARLRAARRGVAVDYRVAGAEALPFDEGSFDAVVSRLVFHHLPGEVKRRALGEMARVLRPGGRLLIADLASVSAQGAHHVVAHPLGSAHDAGVDLARLVQDAGFVSLTQGKLMHGLLAGVAAQRPEGSAPA
jgi:ubiquinone/menaquinone biosynthesis C-methylase UbiE